MARNGQRIFFSLSSTYFTVYRGGPMVLLQRKLYFSKDPEGSDISQGGPTFSRWGGGVLISDEHFIMITFGLIATDTHRVS